MEIVPASGWDRLAGDIFQRKGTAVLLGEADTGKSTLARYLLETLLGKSVSVCLVDADVGQSALGLPATISARVFRIPRDLSGFKPGSIFFIGTTDPAKSISRMILGTGKMAVACRRKRPAVTIVDTTGLVSGRVGMALKLGKIHALHPEHVIAIQKKGELERMIPILREDGFSRIHRLKASSHAHATSRASRENYRKEKFRLYFRKSKTIRFSMKGMGFYRRGKPFDFRDEAEPGCLVGLERGENCLGLGIFGGRDADVVLIRTPLRSFGKVDRISFGEIMTGG